jgi:1,2-phenylacetyl-CoA epoxidase PaaB subunit
MCVLCVTAFYRSPYHLGHHYCPACCLPRSGPLKSLGHLIAFRRKMASEKAREQYRRRGRIVEFWHAWMKSKLGLRQFHVRGLVKVQLETLWAGLTYNLQHWIRLSKQSTTATVA